MITEAIFYETDAPKTSFHRENEFIHSWLFLCYLMKATSDQQGIFGIPRGKKLVFYDFSYEKCYTRFIPDAI